LVAVTVGHPEHLRDHGERQRERETADHIELAIPFGRVERRVDELLDSRAQCGDRVRRERLGHQPAETRVVGGVAIQHRRTPQGGGLAEAVGDELVERARTLGLVDAHVAASQHRLHVVVPEHDRDAERRLMDGVALAQHRVLRIRIGGEPGLERVVHDGIRAGGGGGGLGHDGLL